MTIHPPFGTPPAPTGSAPQPPETSPVSSLSAELPEPSTTEAAESPQNALDTLASYGPPQWARPSVPHGFPGSAFTPQPDGTLRCPAGHPLYVQERRPERNGSLRVLYAARIGHCRPCPLREQCQESITTLKPRRVSAVFWPRSSPSDTEPSLYEAPIAEAPACDPPVPAQPMRWGDWLRCQIRRTFVQLLRTQTVLITSRATETLVHAKPHSQQSPPVSTRAERAHWRLSWEQRFARNARPPTAPSLEILLHGRAFAVYSVICPPRQTNRLIPLSPPSEAERGQDTGKTRSQSNGLSSSQRREAHQRMLAPLSTDASEVMLFSHH